MNESKSKSISLSAVLALSLAGWLAGKKTLVLRVFIAIPYKCICSLPAFHLLIGPTQSRDSLPRDPTPGHGRPTTLVNRTSDDETPSRQQQPVSSPRLLSQDHKDVHSSRQAVRFLTYWPRRLGNKFTFDVSQIQIRPSISSTS